MDTSVPIVATATASSSSSTSGILSTPLSSTAMSSPPVSSPALASTSISAPLPPAIQADFKIPEGASTETVDPFLPASPSTTSFSTPSLTSLAGLYSENVAAKIWRVAESYLEAEPELTTYPEYIPQSSSSSSGDDGSAAVGHYLPKPAMFWTCGFFPASLYCVLERAIKYGVPGGATNNIPTGQFVTQLLALGRRWIVPLQAQVHRTNSHDLGFIVRSLRMDWELTSNPASLEGYCTAAASLATRYSPLVGAIRSWDRTASKRYEIGDPDRNFLVIVDSMCNMDLLFYAARHTNNPQLAAIATQHARTVLHTLVRPQDNSTWHVANLDPTLAGGVVQYQMTHQGYSDGSTWSRGQAWAVLGFAQTYGWTALPEFLMATQRVADCFLKRLEESPAASHTYVPLWDFDAPVQDADQQDSNGQPLRDTSAGLIAANGLLLLHQALEREDAETGTDRLYDGRYLAAALRIVHETLGYSLDREDVAAFTVDSTTGAIHVPAGTWDAILRHSTANNNQHALVRYADTGLVYADYYFLELGNQLLRMGLQVAPRQ